MTPKQEQSIANSYGQVAFEAFVLALRPEHVLSPEELRRRWRRLSRNERNAWIEVGKKVRDVFAAACSV